MEIHAAFLTFDPEKLRRALMRTRNRDYPLTRAFNALQRLGFWAQRTDKSTASVSKGFQPVQIMQTKYAGEEKYTLSWKLDAFLIAMIRMEMEMKLGFKTTDHDIRDALMAMAAYDDGLAEVTE